MKQNENKPMRKIDKTFFSVLVASVLLGFLMTSTQSCHTIKHHNTRKTPKFAMNPDSPSLMAQNAQNIFQKTK